MTDLSTLVEGLKREIAVPGEFDTTFPNTADSDLEATLGDAFAECQMDGFFSTMSLDTGTFVVTPDLSAAGGALVIIYGSMRILRSYIRELGTRSLYEAGPVKYETERAASVLKEELVYLKERKASLIAQGKTSGRQTYVYDGYFARAATDWSDYGGFYSYEMG
jgi:hypothetical protein